MYLRDIDLLEAAKHFESGLAHIEGEIFLRVKADVDREDNHEYGHHHLIFAPDSPSETVGILNGGTLHIDYKQSNDGEEWDERVTVEAMREDGDDALSTEYLAIDLLELSEV